MRIRNVMLITALTAAPAAGFAQGGSQPGSQQQSGAQQQPYEVDTFEMSAGRGQLGVMVMGLTPELRSYFGAPQGSGLLVAQVMPDSPAQRAGIKVGDVITRVGNQPVQSPDDVLSSISSSSSGGGAQAKNVTIALVRNHKQMSLQTKLPGSSATQGSNSSNSGESI